MHRDKGDAPRSGRLDGIAEVTLETADPERLANFYCRAFGCQVLTREEDRVWLAVGESARLGLWTPGRKEFGDRGGRHLHFALRVAPQAFDDLARHLAAEGIPIKGPVTHEGGDRSLYVDDPEGNVVELWDFFHRGGGARRGVDALV